MDAVISRRRGGRQASGYDIWRLQDRNLRRVARQIGIRSLDELCRLSYAELRELITPFSRTKRMGKNGAEQIYDCTNARMYSILKKLKSLNRYLREEAD